jgi:hypothetical protein
VPTLGPGFVFYNAWTVGAGIAYGLTQSGGLTTVRLGQASVTLAPITLAARQSITATDTVAIAEGQPQTSHKVQATLKNTAGVTMAANGISCVVNAPIVPG